MFFYFVKSSSEYELNQFYGFPFDLKSDRSYAYRRDLKRHVKIRRGSLF